MGTSLKRIRESRGMNVETLARGIGVHPNTIRNWEKSKTEPGASDLVKLSKLLECEVEELIDFA